MSTPAKDEALANFERERPSLLRIAHRMLGSVAEAEDVVQAAWLRWQATDRAAIENPAAWLTRTVSRLAIDVLRSARVRREVYVGPWLPESAIADNGDELAHEALSTALMLALERLSPLERAAFLLHDVFGLPFAEIAKTLERDPAAVRQLAARARRRVREARPRFSISIERQRDLVAGFLAASRSGDVSSLEAMLAADVRLLADGGGVRPAAGSPLLGRDAVVSFFAKLARAFGGQAGEIVRFTTIDGLPGVVTREADGLLQTTALELGPDGIEAIYVQRNPHKLAHVRLN